MSGRRLFWIVTPVLALALVLQVRDAGRRWRASRIVQAVETVSQAIGRSGSMARPQIAHNLDLLHEAAALDPALADVRVALGWQYQLLERPDEAVRLYEEALEFEPRAEIYANLGRSRLAAGDAAGAREAFAIAVRLHPMLAGSLAGSFRQVSAAEPPP